MESDLVLCEKILSDNYYSDFYKDKNERKESLELIIILLTTMHLKKTICFLLFSFYLTKNSDDIGTPFVLYVPGNGVFCKFNPEVFIFIAVSYHLPLCKKAAIRDPNLVT